MNDKTIGNYLKSLREEKELTLEDISKATKIKIRFLEDIENNRFNNLGGVGYAKAMSYTYGRYLDADLQYLLKMLNRKFPETVLQDFDEPEVVPKKYFLSTSIITIAIIIIFIIGISILILTNKTSKKILTPKSTTEQIIKKDEKTSKKADSKPINTEILKDTTNYLDKYLFKKKKNPFKADE